MTPLLNPPRSAADQAWGVISATGGPIGPSAANVERLMNRPSRRTTRDVLAVACSTALVLGFGATRPARGEIAAVAAAEAEAAAIDPATGDPDFTKLDLEGLM